MTEERNAVVTGASAGFGAATARALAATGFTVHVGARRLDRLEELAAEIGGSAAALNVTSADSVERFAAGCPDTIDLLVNNAGKALGRDRLEDSSDESWSELWGTPDDDEFYARVERETGTDVRPDSD